MPIYAPQILRNRNEQADFALSDLEIERLRRFGEERCYAEHDYVVRAGEVGFGIAVLLSGWVTITRREGLGYDHAVSLYGRRHFMGEVGQLSGGVSFFDARAGTTVVALVIPPDRLRALVIAEAELGERIMRALILRRLGYIEANVGGPLLIDSPGASRLLSLEVFLTRNGVPFRVLDPATQPDAHALLDAMHATETDLPVVVCPDGTARLNPTLRELAIAVGLRPSLDPDKCYDVAVVGAGPAGLATAVYASSEGLCVAVLEAQTIGGQAGASSRIENYLGFPTGITGQALSGRAFIQAKKFGADVVIPGAVERLSCSDPECYTLKLTDGTVLSARTVVIATGAEYRKLDVEGLSEGERDGVHFWVSPVEARLCHGQEVVLVGGGNSAGQAAVYLAQRVKKVRMLVRSAGIEESMSAYLVERIRAQANIELCANSEVDRLEFDAAGMLREIGWRHMKTGALSAQAIRHLFLFIGASPCTRWLSDCTVAIDTAGFVLTGAAARPTEMNPPSHMTSKDGLFAIGDVRSGSAKRVAAAVGDGAAVVAQIHAYLSQRAHA